MNRSIADPRHETLPRALAGQRRVIVQEVQPEIDCGRYPIKRIVGQEVVVRAAAFADGHDLVRAMLLWRRDDDKAWQRTPMESVGQDLWQGRFQVNSLGCYRYTVQGWVDRFHTWKRDLEKRYAANQDLALELRIGADLVSAAGQRAEGDDRRRLLELANALATHPPEAAIGVAFDGALAELMDRYPDLELATTYCRELEVVVDRQRAGFSAWYEIFPRSCSPLPGRHGTLRDLEGWLPYIADLGFDVLYLPPIHPIGRTFRKGKNNAPLAEADDVGSPWGIGASEGGHKSIHPSLGTMDDFRHLLAAAAAHGLEVALDIAFQTSPDHPYVKEHPEWFRHRPDGSIQYAENPPKKYQDIYPFDFETPAWRSLWTELKEIILFWVEQGVRIFRVDNPHTKPFAFWEWLIREVQRGYPDTIFLAEAFTRPRVMTELAKLGFTQSYTYFTWRNTKGELTDYIRQLTETDVRQYMRPNLWPNTPDILHEYLQMGGRAAFMARFVLAATLSANYGIYGPAFELCERRPREPGSEEYLDSEKYQIRTWNRDDPDSLAWLIARVNQIRRENAALARNELTFLAIDNEQMIAYAKQTPDHANVIIVVVNLDPDNVHSGWLEVPLELLGISPHRTYQVHDLVTDARYLWHGSRNFVKLDPRQLPAHILRVRHWLRTEHDFEYYL
jgi:starch synthase (maltosyl-transferring)